MSIFFIVKQSRNKIIIVNNNHFYSSLKQLENVINVINNMSNKKLVRPTIVPNEAIWSGVIFLCG